MEYRYNPVTRQIEVRRVAGEQWHKSAHNKATIGELLPVDTYADHAAGPALREKFTAQGYQFA